MSSSSIDPKELKILSDILALVLEDQPGQASNALDAIRKRAQRNAITGGAIKNLFVAIAPNPPPKASPRSRAQSGTQSADSAAARKQITTLTNDIRRLDMDLRNARAQAASLKSELDQTRESRAALQAQIYAQRGKKPLRQSLVTLAFIVGALVGIATTQFVHHVQTPPQTDNLPYLHP